MNTVCRQDAGPHAPGARHLAVVVSRRDEVEAALAEAARVVGEASARLSIVGVPARRPVVNHLAALSGAVTYEELAEEARREAVGAARLAALSAPACAQTTYRCVPSLGAACLLRALREGMFCALVLSRRPPRADRRRVQAAARAGGAPIVLVAPAARVAPALPAMPAAIASPLATPPAPAP